jgi:ribosome-associated protein
MVAAAYRVPRTRRPTRATRGSKQRRVQSKKHRSEVKALRRRVDE